MKCLTPVVTAVAVVGLAFGTIGWASSNVNAAGCKTSAEVP